MQFKLVPEPPDSLETLVAAHRAVPLVPGSEDDCCERLMRRVGFESRDVARTWLTFLRALCLARETDRGFVRVQTEPTPDHLREALASRVLLADAVRSAVGEDPVTATTAFSSVRGRVPTWERQKNPGTWEEVWTDRIDHLLGWWVLVGNLERVEGGYVSPGRAP